MNRRTFALILVALAAVAVWQRQRLVEATWRLVWAEAAMATAKRMASRIGPRPALAGPLKLCRRSTAIVAIAPLPLHDCVRKIRCTKNGWMPETAFIPDESQLARGSLERAVEYVSGKARRWAGKLSEVCG